MNQKTRVVTQLPGKLTTRGRGACQESCARRSDIKSQLNTLDLPLNHKSEGKKRDWLYKTMEKGGEGEKKKERKAFYLLRLGRDRSIAAAADRGVLSPLNRAVWPGPGTAAPLCASSPSSPPPRFNEPPAADERDRRQRENTGHSLLERRSIKGSRFPALCHSERRGTKRCAHKMTSGRKDWN